LARQAVIRSGGYVENNDGREFFVIPVQMPIPSIFMQSYRPGPIANSKYTEQEMSKIDNCYREQTAPPDN
jgi:hypothetical protein